MAPARGSGPRRRVRVHGEAWGLRQIASTGMIGLALLTACGPPASARPTPRPTPTPVPVPTLESNQVARGRQVYLQHCGSCHGPNAEGAPNWQKPDARGNLPAPPHDDTGHTWRHSDQELAMIIRNGLRDPFNKTPELTMPPFDGQLSDKDIADVIAYFKSLWSLEHRQFQEQQNLQSPMQMPSPSPAAGQ